MPVIGGTVPDDTKEAVDELKDDHEQHENRSDAIKHALEVGLDQLGYLDDGAATRGTQTGLRDIIQSAYRGALWAVLLLVGLTWVGPVEARLVVLALTPIPAALWLVDRGLARIEPRATQALTAAIGGDWQ